MVQAVEVEEEESTRNRQERAHAIVKREPKQSVESRSNRQERAEAIGRE